jgi:DUF1365 family protein
MDMQYEWSFGEPRKWLTVHMRNFQAGDLVFDATLALEADTVSAPALLMLLAGYPLMTLKVIAAIHWQALKLWLKRVPLHNHPAKAAVGGRP